MIDIHYWPTPNGKKVTILLEELEIDYQIIPCDINRGDQFNADFLKISPNTASRSRYLNKHNNPK